MPSLIIYSGVPGSGKTTSSFEARNFINNLVVLSSDGIREELWGSESYYDPEEEHRVWELIISRAKAAAEQGKNVIIDSSAITNSKRMWFYHELGEYFTQVGLEIFKPPLNLCIERDRMRVRTVGAEVIRRMYEKFEAPDWEVWESYDYIEFSRF